MNANPAAYDLAKKAEITNITQIHNTSIDEDPCVSFINLFKC